MNNSTKEQDLNDLLINIWNKLLKSDLRGNKGSFEEELNVLRNELLKKFPSLDTINSGVEKLLGNNFFKESMGACYRNNQQKLEENKKELRKIVTRKNKIRKGLKDELYKINSLPLPSSENIDVNFESASSKTHLDKFIGLFSNEKCINYFDVSPLKKTLDSIYAEVTSESFQEKYLENLYGKLSRELKSEKYSEVAIESLLKEILAGLLKKGFVKDDFPSLDSQLQKLDDMIHVSTKWTVLVSMGGIEFKDRTEYKIGKVKFYDKNTYDYSKLIDATNTQSKKNRRIINFFKDKHIVETEVDAYGKNGAKENGFFEISKVIDILSLWKSDVMIKEPKFEKYFEFIVINRENENPFPDWGIDPRYVLKVKLDETIKGFLKDFDHIFNKPYNAFTELEKNVANASHWHRKGNMSKDLSDKFLNYIIALESLLSTEEDRGSRKQEIISTRAMKVMWILPEYREKYKDKIIKMYDYRNKIVHEGSTDIFNLKGEAEGLGTITRNVLLNVKGKIDECETLEKFLESNEEEIRKKREDELENARKLGIELNKEINGKGLLKKKSGEDVGEIDFKFWIKDDDPFVITEGNIYDFKRIGGGTLSLSPTDEFIIEGKLENIEGKLVIKEIEPLDIFFGWVDYTNKKEMQFRVYSFDIM